MSDVRRLISDVCFLPPAIEFFLCGDILASTSYSHSGFFPGYMTDMMYFPEQKIAVAVQIFFTPKA